LTFIDIPSNYKTVRKIWVRYNNKEISISEAILEEFEIYNVSKLKETLKARFEIKNNVIIRRGSDNLKGSESVAKLYNTAEEALEIIVEDGKH
jgi:hypothetical protein